MSFATPSRPFFFPSANFQPGSQMGDYVFRREVGRGKFSLVYEAVDIRSSTRVAIKIIEKAAVDPYSVQKLLRKIEIMRKMNHPNVLGVREVHENQTQLGIVMEFIGGGYLFQELLKKRRYTEQDAAFITRQIVEGVAYLHGMGVSHRDIRPENLMITDEEDFDFRRVVITDFGFAKLHGAGELMKSAVGQPKYVSPEVLSAGFFGGNYGPSCDIWSVGVLAFILLSGRFPFDGFDDTLYNNISQGNFSFNSPEWASVSKLAQQFISDTLVVDPTARPTALQLLSHPWLQADVMETDDIDLKMSVEYLRNKPLW